MKFITWLFTILTLVKLINSIRSKIYAPYNVISLKDITPDERRQIAYLEQKLERAKRSGGGSGSGEILNILKTSIGNGIKKKIGQLTKASAAASGEFSRTSSGKGKEYYPHHYPEHPQPDHHQSSFDFWDLKKSILNTLLQAVKAIKGGVLAVKGQLIKGGGKLVSASGQLVSSQGEAITSLGKHIATNAILVPYHSSKGNYHEHVEPENHYSASGSPEEIYHSGPSGSNFEYQVPESYPPVHHDGASGLLILKKIENSNHRVSSNSHQSLSPSASSILGKFFSASSSLDPEKPNLFGNDVRSYNKINSYQVPLRTKDNEIMASASGTVTQQVPTTELLQNQIAPSDDSTFEESPNYLDQNFDSSTTKQIKNLPQVPKDNNNAPHDNNYNFEAINSFGYGLKNSQEGISSNIPDLTNSGLKSTDINSFLETGVPLSNYKLEQHPNSILTYSKPTKFTLSPYLETPKFDYSQLSEIKFNEPSLSIQQSLSEILNQKPVNGQQLNFDLVPSISYEVGPEGPKQI